MNHSVQPPGHPLNIARCTEPMSGTWSPRRIAVVRALHLGDLLHAVPALRALRNRFTEAEITLIGLPWARSFASRFGHYIDRFLEFPGYPGIAEAEYDAERTQDFLRDQRHYGFDLAIQMHGSGFTSNSFARGLGAKVDAGFYDHRNPDLLSVNAAYPDRLSEIERNLELVRLLGCAPDSRELEFPIFSEDAREADDLLSAPLHRPLFGIHTSSRAPSRRWPPERFAHLADEIKEYTGGTVLLTGGPDDVDDTRHVRSLMTQPAIDLAGRTSLGGLAALISRLDLFLSNDTGPAHIARALGTPSVTVFGPADPVRWAARGQGRHRIVREAVHCSPCLHWDCPIDHRCVRWIPVSRVLDEVMELLGQRRSVCVD